MDELWLYDGRELTPKLIVHVKSGQLTVEDEKLYRQIEGQHEEK